MFQKRSLAALEEKVKEINALEPAMAALSDAELTAKSLALRERVRAGAAAGDGGSDAALDEIAAEAFALVREAAKRTLGQRPFDVQLVGRTCAAQRRRRRDDDRRRKDARGRRARISECARGQRRARRHRQRISFPPRRGVDGKDLPRARAHRRVHRSRARRISTIPNGRSQRQDEAAEDKKVETTGSFLVQQEFLRPVSRREAYRADITYGTNHEFGFDYLRDNLVYRLEDRVQRGHNFAIIDEVDSILIDEARTPLIIAAPDAQSSDFYKAFARIATQFGEGRGLRSGREEADDHDHGRRRGKSGKADRRAEYLRAGEHPPRPLSGGEHEGEGALPARQGLRREGRRGL